MVLPVSTSPLSIASTPSRSRASANFLSILTRFCTSSLKLFVFAMVGLRSTSPALTELVIFPVAMRCIDIALLPLLGPAGQQDDDCLTIPSKINSIARTKIDSIFQYAFSHRFDIGEIALLHAGKRAGDLGAGCRIHFLEPLGKGIFAARGDAVADFKHTLKVTHMFSLFQGHNT